MKKRNLLAWVALTCLSFADLGVAAAADTPRTPNKQPEQSGFVSVEGRHFVLDGQAYYFAGANLWYGMYLGSPGPGGDRARLIRELDQLAAQGVKNLRVLAISEASSLKRAVTPALLQAPGRIDDTLWRGLDFLLDEMAKRDMKAVLYLTNFWQWSGGMAQQVAWFSGKPVVDPDVTGDWNTFMDSAAGFYREPKAQQVFRDTLAKLIPRRNSVNGRVYDADPTIMSWQLANEPRPGSDANAKPHFDAFVKWVDETAGFIKRLAPRQLVSTGSEGWMGTAGSKELFRTAHAGANVDYLTFHMWAPNWRWFDPKNAAATYEPAWRKMQDYLDWHIDLAGEMEKPIVLEEFGINRDEGSFDPAVGTVYRDRFYARIFELLARRAAAGDAIAGSNFWAWGGEGRTQNADFMWKAGDRFVGDPPQEPQGLYCVFDSDRSTMRIVGAHAREMSGLRPKR